MDTVVAVDVTQLFVTYAVMDREHKILQLNRIDMPAETTRNSIPALYELAEFVYPKLAKKGDVYIMEQPSSHLQNVSSSMMSRRILQSMVYTMLNFGEPDYPKVQLITATVEASVYIVPCVMISIQSIAGIPTEEHGPVKALSFEDGVRADRL